ncbi:hypothetical protein SAMN06295967_10959 [Belliella buryatensis]|uniref:Glycosyltransferase 2-like domain-containing protein n=1 Tax=Belliella buryatensis TaxID=1500549 RepID=A0A239ECR1_9BACT|nr:glycosyltransferase family 2 protein [Belliella buryatensis]SNS41803.1 hypothetical protein SAMN06295967_10959 [Belliella buryatensis]
MAAITQPSVAIIIINWNNFNDTQKCLNSLKKCDYPNFQSIVVDNDSQDGSGRKLEDEFKDFAYFIFSDSNRGFTGGNNLGLKYALDQGFEYVMELNNDTEVEPDFITKLIDSIVDKPEYGAAQPLIYFNTPNRHIVWNAGGNYIRPLGISQTKYKNVKDSRFIKASETDWITGCAFLIKSEVIKKTGLLKEFYFFGSFEDVDLSMRIRNLGYKLWFEPSAVIYHSVGGSSKSKTKGKEGYLNPKVHYLTQRNQMIFINHHTPTIFKPVAVLTQVIKLLAYSLYFLVLWRPIKLKMVWKGFKDGLFKTYHD